LIAISFLDGAQDLKDFLFDSGFDSFAAQKVFFMNLEILQKKYLKAEYIRMIIR